MFWKHAFFLNYFLNRGCSTKISIIDFGSRGKSFFLLDPCSFKKNPNLAFWGYKSFCLGCLNIRFLKVLWFNYILQDLLCPVRLTFFWAFGFLVGGCLVYQILSGFFLTFHYSSFLPFERVVFLSRERFFGDILRSFHANGVSLFFFALFLHVFRGVVFSSFLLIPVWVSGVLILFLSIIVGFVGYSLPWAQISFWAASVITNLRTAVPLFGVELAQYIWGGFSLSDVTLVRFYSLHYILPFFLLVIGVLHIILLHLIHSQAPIGLKSEGVKFFPIFLFKDFFFLMLLLLFLLFFRFFFRFFFMEKEMFEVANPLMSPEHIVPEWYFLPFYAILRAVPSKLGGVVLMIFIFVGMIFLVFKRSVLFLGVKNIIILFWWFLDWGLLFWVGSLPVIFPFDIVGKGVCLGFFSLFMF